MYSTFLRAMSTITSAKVNLRAKILETVKTLPLENKRLQSKKIRENILSSNLFNNSQRISIFLSTIDEVDTIDILRAMFQQNKHVFVPTYKERLMKLVRLKSMDDYENLGLTGWKIKQPDFNEDREEALDSGGLDLIFVPGAAFSTCGGRLGKGGGMYDKYLNQYFQKYPEKFGPGLSIEEKLADKKTILIGLGFKEQIIDHNILPLEPHDFPVDCIISADE